MICRPAQHASKLERAERLRHGRRRCRRRADDDHEKAPQEQASKDAQRVTGDATARALDRTGRVAIAGGGRSLSLRSIESDAPAGRAGERRRGPTTREASTCTGNDRETAVNAPRRGLEETALRATGARFGSKARGLPRQVRRMARNRLQHARARAKVDTVGRPRHGHERRSRRIRQRPAATRSRRAAAVRHRRGPPDRGHGRDVTAPPRTPLPLPAARKGSTIRAADESRARAGDCEAYAATRARSRPHACVSSNDKGATPPRAARTNARVATTRPPRRIASEVTSAPGAARPLGTPDSGSSRPARMSQARPARDGARARASHAQLEARAGRR